MGNCAVEKKEKPGANPLGDNAAPFEIAVAALPVVGEDADIARDFCGKAQVNPQQRNGCCCRMNVNATSRISKCDFNFIVGPAVESGAIESEESPISLRLDSRGSIGQMWQIH